MPSGVIVLIDVEECISEVLGAVLQDAGYSTIELTSETDWMQVLGEMFPSLYPDLLLVDVVRLHPDGSRFLRRYGRSPYQEVPVLFMTTDGRPEPEWERTDTRVLRCPFDLSELEGAVQMSLSLRSKRLSLCHACQPRSWSPQRWVAE